MCGIAVSLNPERVAPPLLLEKLQHRGPDGSAEWRSGDGHVWLGHTRLAILDLSPSGAQPMLDRATGNVIVFNGEIYNHLALRQELKNQGVDEWIGSSDTETLLTAYRVWGRQTLARLKGMFAFALYDAQAAEVLLARDRLGIKPLFFVAEGASFHAASETRALPVTRWNPVRLEAVASYLRWGACPEENLLPAGVKVLPAGHWLSLAVETGARRTGAFWPSERIRTVSESPSRRLRELLDTAVREHLLADVPVAAFLSGGIDSSVITALAARAMNRRLRTFSVGFREAGFDETAVAAEVARRFNTEHTRIELDAEETIAIVREAVEKMDLPSVDAINTYIVSKKVAEQGMKVALSGLGGDELFGGYPSFRDVPRLARIPPLPAVARRGLAAFGNIGRRLAELPGGDAFEVAQWRRSFFTDTMLASLGLPSPELPENALPDLPDDFAKISWAELTRYMRHLLLRDSDQMSMAVSLELRVPFLDHELVEYVLGLPAALKTREPRLKSLLVESCGDLVPSSVYQRPKMGFALPMDKWMRGPLRSFVAVGLHEAIERCGLPARAIDQLRVQFERKQLHWTRLWSLVILGHYLCRVNAQTPNIVKANLNPSNANSPLH
jgi:asparagine synthase (glutamine-hydrolysing)